MIVLISSGRADAELLRRVVAGLPFAEQLPARLRTVAPEVGIAAPGEPAKGAVLEIERDAWFSLPALSALTALARGAAPVEVVAGEDVLARYRPATAAAPLRLEAAALDPADPPWRIADLLDLARVEGAVLYERACAALRAGVWIPDPRSVAIRGQLSCGRGVEIDRDVIIEGRVVLGDGVRIGPHSIVRDAEIGAGSRVNPFSLVEGCTIGRNSFVGPYGRVRPGSRVGDSVQLGNFVEIKNAVVGAGSRINHLAFVGDATLGERVTIGAGTITCNHDGTGVQRTEIGAGAYVGSGCMLVAPLKVGEEATVAAGSTLTRPVPAGKLVVARARQVTVDRWKRRGSR